MTRDMRVDGLWRDVDFVMEYYGEANHTREGDRAQDHNREARLRGLGFHVEIVVRADLAEPAALRSRLLGVRAGLLSARSRG